MEQPSPQAMPVSGQQPQRQRHTIVQSLQDIQRSATPATRTRRTNHCTMGLADIATGGMDASENPQCSASEDHATLFDDCDELDVSAVVVNRLLTEDKCLVDQLDDCACHAGEDDDDQRSLAGTFVGEDEDDLLPQDRTIVAVEVTNDDRPTLFNNNKRTDSSRSSFSMRGTSIMSASPCTCGGGGDSDSDRRRRSRLMSASEEYLESHMRFGLGVRVTGIESVDMHSRFVIRVEDLETKKHWEVRKTAKEMAHFYNQIRHICMEQAPVKKEMWGTFRGLRKLRLPKKFLHSRGALCYQRRVVYDSLLRHTAALISPAPMGPRRRQVVQLLQQFLDVTLYCDAADRELRDGNCTCWADFPTHRVNASQLVGEVFSDPRHGINRECAEFVKALTKKTHDTRRTRLYTRQAQAILRTITKKMTEVKKLVLSDVGLLQRVATLRHEMPESEFDDFVDDVRRAAAGFVQKAVLVELEDHVYESLQVLYADEEDKSVLPKLRVLQTKPQAFFGIPDHLQSWTDWEDARVELRRLNEFALPLDKLKCILRASSAIFGVCHGTHNKRKSIEAAASCVVAPVVSTDDFLQILFYVVSRSELSRPLLTLQLLRLTCDQDDLTGEMGYYFANFEAAMKLVDEVRLE